MKAAGWHIGVIGGTGLYDADTLEGAQQIAVGSPFGKPSGPVTMGTIGGATGGDMAQRMLCILPV